MSSPPKTHLAPEEFLEAERKAESKSEYLQGEIFPRPGGSWPHNLVVANTFCSLRSQLHPQNCEILVSDMRVGSAGFFAYPDLVVYCGEPRFLDEQEDTLLNPFLIVEVLSPATELYDVARKFEEYQLIESLQEYLLISSDRVHADLYTRQPVRGWLFRTGGRREDSIKIPSVGCVLNLADIYDRVKF